MLTAQLLKQIFPRCAVPAGWAQALNPALARYQFPITGRCNYAAVEKKLNPALIEHPDRLLTKKFSAFAAAGFRNSRGLNALADDDTDDDDLEDLTEITRRINGGIIGLKQRLLAFSEVAANLA